jgi:hypothetical protein
MGHTYTPTAYEPHSFGKRRSMEEVCIPATAAPHVDRPPQSSLGWQIVLNLRKAR